LFVLAEIQLNIRNKSVKSVKSAVFRGCPTGKACTRASFEAEQVPKDWTKGLIFPLFKGGDRKLTDNYRGIYLRWKLYASILNHRLLEWCEKRKF